jgi:hypothetical protein
LGVEKIGAGSDNVTTTRTSIALALAVNWQFNNYSMYMEPFNPSTKITNICMIPAR